MFVINILYELVSKFLFPPKEKVELTPKVYHAWFMQSWFSIFLCFCQGKEDGGNAS